MKLECSIEKLKDAISKAERITSKNSTLPILNSILLITEGKSLKLRATNLSLGIEIEIPAKVEQEGITAVEGSVLANIFSNIYQTEKVLLELVENNLSIKTNTSNILIKSYPHEDFPTIPAVSGKSFTLQIKKFIEGIKSVAYSSAVSDIKPEISSVYIYSEPEEDYLIFVSTDSFRLAEKKIIVKKINGFPGILIPFKNISEIIRLFSDDSSGDIKINFSKNQISLSTDTIYLTSRIIDGTFPDYKQIVPKEHTTEVIVLKADLLNALKLTNIFSDKFNQATLTIKPKEKLFELKAKNVDIGENKTLISTSISGEDVEVSFNLKYFVDCFQSIYQDSVTIHLSGDNKPIIIRGSSDISFTYLIMPMNR